MDHDYQNHGRGQTLQPVGGQHSNHFHQTLQQLVQELRSPQSPQQQQRMLAILKSNPQVMSAFIRHRSQAFQQQQELARGSTPVETAGRRISGNVNPNHRWIPEE